MIDRIFIANSAYALFLYLLKWTDQVNSTLFMLGPSAIAADVPNRLALFVRDPKELPVVQNVIQQQTFLLLKGKKVPVYGNVETVFSGFFVNNFEFYPVSDGLRDCVTFPTYLKDKRFKKCYTVRLPGGLDIEDEKLDYLDINALWAAKTPEEKNVITRAFGVTDEQTNILKKKKILLITQPLAEDKIMSFEDKILLYETILKEYNQEDIVIKPHPRELTDYAKMFPSVSVLPRMVPAELLGLLVPDLDRVATFFSTSAFNMLTPPQIDLYSKDFSSLIYFNPENKPRQEGNETYKCVSSFDIETFYKTYDFNWKRLNNPYFYKKILPENWRSFIQDKDRQKD